MALIGTLQDTFPGSSLSAQWTQGLGSSTVSGGACRLPISGATYDSVGSTATYDCTDGSFFVQVAPDAGFVGSTIEFGVYLSTSQGGLSGGVNGFQVDNIHGTLRLRLDNAGTQTTFGSVPYDAVAQNWLRLRISGTTVFGDYSADGVSWTNLASTTFSFAVTALFGGFFAGYDSAQTQVNVAFSNVNVAPIGPIPVSRSARRLPALVQARRRNVVVPAPVPVPKPVFGNRIDSQRNRSFFVVRGRRWVPVRAQVNPPIVVPVRTDSARSRFTMLRRGRQWSPVPKQLNPPVVVPVRVDSERGRSFFMVRGRRWTPIPKQVNPPVVVPNRSSALARRLFALTPRGKQLPVQPQTAALPPTWPPLRLATPRRLLSAAIRGHRATPTPAQADAVARAGASRAKLSTLRRGKPAAAAPDQALAPSGSRPPSLIRRPLGSAGGGKRPLPAQPQIAVTAQVVRRTFPAFRPWAALRKGRAASPAPAQQQAAPPPWPPPKLGAPRRPLSGAQRGRQVSPVPAPVTVPKVVVGNRQPKIRGLAAARRGRGTNPALAQAAPPVNPARAPDRSHGRSSAPLLRRQTSRSAPPWPQQVAQLFFEALAGVVSPFMRLGRSQPTQRTGRTQPSQSTEED